MTTVDEVARAALGAVGPAQSGMSDVLVLAHGWVNERYAQMVSQVRYRHLRKPSSLVLPAMVNTGTVDATRGSDVITGTATIWDRTLEGRWFRGQTAWYEVKSVDSPTVLRLATTYAETGGTDLGYHIAMRYLDLPDTVRFVGSFVIARTWARIIETTLRELDDSIAPGRPYAQSLGAGAFGMGGYICDVGLNADNDKRRYEIWPYPSQDELVHYVFWTAPPKFEADDRLPVTVELYQLKEGVLCDVYRYYAAEAARNGRFDVAGYFSNAEARQGTRWQTAMMDARRQDRGMDDAEFLWRATNGRGYVRDIRTARDEVAARGYRLGG